LLPSDYFWGKRYFIDPLISLLRSGDQNAFRTLVDTYQQQVFNTAISLVQDHSLAEEVCQDVFVAVYKSILSFNEKSALSTWIYRITVNKSLDYLRAHNRRKKAGIFNMLFNGSGAPVQDKVDFVHPGIKMEQKENARYLFAAIETLPDNQKTVFILAHIEELPQKEIAEIMDLSLKAVESLLQRAKGNLRKKLSHIYDRRKNQ
jgi:RNA polymerase sigma-70 factor (ECF subfamily)